MTYLEALADNIIHRRITFAEGFRFLTSRHMNPQIAARLLEEAVANAK